MELMDIRLFCDLVETGSFSRAAERNFVSQSAVSQRLRTMERQYNLKFLERSKGKSVVRLTEAGRILYEGARPLLLQADTLDAQVRGLSDEVTGSVRVATVYSVGLHALPSRLKPFLFAYPMVNVHLEYSQTQRIYSDVLSGAVDVGIVAVPAPRTGIEIVPFGVEEMACICAPEHPFAQKTELTLSCLDGEEFIAFDDDIPTRFLIDEKLREAGVRVHIVMAFDNIETIKNLVEIGSGVALVPADTVRAEVREGTLACVPLAADDRFTRSSGILLKRVERRRAAVRAFVEHVRLLP